MTAVPLPIVFTTLAADQVREAESWWRVNRTAAPNAVRQEVERALQLIAAQPRVGGEVNNVRLPHVRRIFLPKIKYHLYWHIVAEPPHVEVVALWHARRGKGPPI